MVSLSYSHCGDILHHCCSGGGGITTHRKLRGYGDRENGADIVRATQPVLERFDLTGLGVEYSQVDCGVVNRHRSCSSCTRMPGVARVTRFTWPSYSLSVYRIARNFLEECGKHWRMELKSFGRTIAERCDRKSKNSSSPSTALCWRTVAIDQNDRSLDNDTAQLVNSRTAWVCSEALLLPCTGAKSHAWCIGLWLIIGLSPRTYGGMM